jgi:uncharacterized protein
LSARVSAQRLSPKLQGVSATRPPIAERLDVAAFAKARGRLEGRLPVDRLPRLEADLQGPADGSPTEVAWSADGLWSQPAGDEPQVRLRLQVQAKVWLSCQRCLQPVAVPLEIDRTLRFARGEDEAARLDEEGEEDVLALTRSLDLPALVEDELILALPLVPRHGTCPRPLPGSGGQALPPEQADVVPEPAAHPFAALQALKKRG